MDTPSTYLTFTVRLNAFKAVFRLGLVFDEIYVCASYGFHFQPTIHSFFGPVINPAFKYFYRPAALLAASILNLLIFRLFNDW